MRAGKIARASESHADVHVYVYICVCVYVYVYVHAYTYMRICICICICVCMFASASHADCQDNVPVISREIRRPLFVAVQQPERGYLLVQPLPSPPPPTYPFSNLEDASDLTDEVTVFRSGSGDAQINLAAAYVALHHCRHHTHHRQNPY